MLYIKPDYVEQFYCVGEGCMAPCAAPADMTWTNTLGGYCETGLSLACPQAARLILLKPEGVRFRTERDSAPAAPLCGLSQEQLNLMVEARKTMDITLQNRALPIRSNVVLALIYGAEFDPMITTGSRYAYDELDWGFTEQPYRQLSAALTSQGNWEMKRSDLFHILIHLHKLCKGDALLADHLVRTIDMLEPLSGREFRQLRESYDAYLKPREYLFENLMVYYVHRYFLAWASQQTVVPFIKFSMVNYAVLRAMGARIFRETGSLTDEALCALCRHYARCVEETPEIRQALLEIQASDALYSRERLQRLLWQ